MADEFNEWELTSGFALDGAEVEITSAEFGFNANLGADVKCLNVVFTPLNGDEAIEQSFSVGKGWEPSRDGSELVSETGKPKRFAENSNYGRLLKSALALIEPSELGGSPREAAIWIGTRWTMGTVKVTTMNPSTGKERDVDAFVFKAYHGRGDAGAGTSAGAGKSSAKAGSTRVGGNSKPAASDDGVPEGIDADLWEKLVALAKESDSHDVFMDAALEVEGVDGNKAAQKACMGTKAGSVWAAAH